MILDELERVFRDHVGAENSITSQTLSEKLGGLDTLDSTPNTRKKLVELTTQRKIPIGAHNGGFFVISSEEEEKEYKESLEVRKRGIEKRKQAVEQAIAENGYGMPEQTPEYESQKGLSEYD